MLCRIFLRNIYKDKKSSLVKALHLMELHDCTRITSLFVEQSCTRDSDMRTFSLSSKLPYLPPCQESTTQSEGFSIHFFIQFLMSNRKAANINFYGIRSWFIYKSSRIYCVNSRLLYPVSTRNAAKIN